MSSAIKYLLFTRKINSLVTALKPLSKYDPDRSNFDNFVTLFCHRTRDGVSRKGHWLVGKIARSDPKIGRRFGIARRVDHNLEEMPHRYLRYSGLSPLFWWIPSIISSIIFFQTLITALNAYLSGGMLELVDYIQILVIWSFIISALAYTGSDFIAMTDPEEYVRRMRQEGFSESWGYPALFGYLLTKFPKPWTTGQR